MRVLLVFLFFSTFIVAGWWLRQAGPERWPKVTTNTNAPDTTITNSVVNAPSPSTSSSPTNTTTPSTIILPSPSNLVATATETEVTLTWDPVPFAHGYAITRNDVFLGVVYGTKFLDFALNAGTSYVYSVGSVDTLNIASATLAQVTATTPMTVATAPTTTTPTNTTTTKPSTKPTTTTKPTTNTPTNTTPTTTTPPTTTTTPTNTAVTTPANTATTTPPPPPVTNTNTVVTPPPPACGQGGACTTAEIASHSTRSNCWVYLTTVNKVYNITGYVSSGSRHPGGDVIVPFCGQNITAPFTSSASGGKKHSSSALNSILQAYYIGPLTP